MYGAILGLLFATPVSAEQATVGDKFREVAPASFVNAFVGHCVHNPGRLDKVGAAAKALEYADTPEPFWTMLAPQDPSASYHSWFVIEGEGSPYLLGISEAPLRGTTYQICAVSNPFLDEKVALNALNKLMALGASSTDETVAGQRYRTWFVPEVLEGAFLSASDIKAMGASGVTLSLAAPKQYE
jgi:hypothetical protein